MITRKELEKIIFNMDSPSRADEILALLEPYTALMDAAVILRTGCRRENLTHASRKVWDLAEPFIEPLLSEKLDKLATERHGGKLGLVLRQFAGEARELEK